MRGYCGHTGVMELAAASACPAGSSTGRAHIRLVCAAAAACIAVALSISAFVLTALNHESLWYAVTSPAVLLSAAVGLLIALRRPGNLIGWLLLASALALGCAFLAEPYARYALVTDPGSLPAARWAVLWDKIDWPTMFAGMTALAFLFPDGRLLPGRWRKVAIAALVSVAGAIAVFRYRLFDIELILSRTIVYGTLSLTVVATYLGLVVGLDRLVHVRGVAGALAAALVALGAQPLRHLLQGRVQRFVYGDRSDPYVALARLGERLQATPDPAEVLSTIVDSVAVALRLGYAAIELERDATRSMPAENRNRVDMLLTELRSETQEAIADIRRLVYELRPPALDELGLIGALSEQAARLSQAGGPRIAVDGPDDLVSLPAAVEVAAYRIAAEALPNAARHASARACSVLPSCDRARGGA